MPAPTSLILEMQKSGLNDAEIIERLREQGYTDRDINDAINQAKVKQTIKTEEFQEPARQAPALAPLPNPEQNVATPITGQRGEFVPTPSPTPASQPTTTTAPEMQYEYEQPSYEGYEGYGDYGTAATTEAFEEIAESIIEERWRAFMEKVGDLQAWKERTEKEISRIEKRIEKIDDALTSIHTALLTKVDEYGKGVRNLGTDVKAMEKAFSQVLQPMMKKAKEIKGITKGTREKGKSKR